MPVQDRTKGLVATLSVGTVVFAAVVNQHYPLRDWLFFWYLGYWLATVVWAAACTCFGYRATADLLPRRLGMSERLSLGFAAGVLAFGLSIFFIGLAHGLGSVTFLALPLGFLAFGAPRLLGDARPWLAGFEPKRAFVIDDEISHVYHDICDLILCLGAF